MDGGDASVGDEVKRQRQKRSDPMAATMIPVASTADQGMKTSMTELKREIAAIERQQEKVQVAWESGGTYRGMNDQVWQPPRQA